MTNVVKDFLILFYQVYDLGVQAPDKVLHQLYANLEKLKKNGDHYAAEIQNRLRIIVSWSIVFSTFDLIFVSAPYAIAFL